MIDEGCIKTIADYINTKEAPDRTKDKTTATDPATKRSYQPWNRHTDEGDYIMCVVWASQYSKYTNGPEKPFRPLYTVSQYARPLRPGRWEAYGKRIM
jgi:hypothetical protein